MALSFWKKQGDNISTAESYMKATKAVSRPMAGAMMIFGILVVGGLLFGVFWGARWSFDKLANNGNTSKPTTVATTNKPTGPTSGSTDVTTPSITATSSTSTTTPSTPAPATVPVTTANLPHTGPASNAVLFLVIFTLSYLVYRREQIKD